MKPLVITGPTASGKSDLALAVALANDAEIISMDSRQIYRGMDIGTAKPSTAERAAIPHHGLDLIDPDQRYSAGQFARDARCWLDDIAARNRPAVIVGGTGFFLRALLEPMFAEPALSNVLREPMKRFLATLELERLRAWAQALEPGREVGALDRQRLARLVEVTLLTGRPLSWWHRHAPPLAPALDLTVVTLDMERAALYRRIDERVTRMVEAGLVAEVAGLLERGYGPQDPGMNATGYIELIPHLRGERTLDEAVTLIRNATRGYARRQLTWFRNQLPPAALVLDAALPLDELARLTVEEWRRREA